MRFTLIDEARLEGSQPRIKVRGGVAVPRKGPTQPELAGELLV